MLADHSHHKVARRTPAPFPFLSFFGYSDTPQGAHASAVIYSVIETAKANGLEPYAYLRHMFGALPAAASIEDFEALLLWNINRDMMLINNPIG